MVHRKQSPAGPSTRRAWALAFTALSVLPGLTASAPFQQGSHTDAARNLGLTRELPHPLPRGLDISGGSKRYQRLAGGDGEGDSASFLASSSASVDALPQSRRDEPVNDVAARFDAPEHDLVQSKREEMTGAEALERRQANSAFSIVLSRPVAAAATTRAGVAAAVSSTSVPKATVASTTAAVSSQSKASSTAAVSTTSALPSSSTSLSASSSASTTSQATTSSSTSSPTSSASSSSQSKTSTSSTSSASASSTSAAASSGFSLTDSNNKLFPLWVAVTVLAILAGLFIVLCSLRYCFFKPAPRLEEDSICSGPITAPARGATLKNGAKSLRKALTRRKLAGASFNRRQQEGSVLLDVGDEVYAVPASVAQEYAEAKRLFGPGSDTASMSTASTGSSRWNGKQVLMQIQARHEEEQELGSRRGIDTTTHSRSGTWNSSSCSTLAGADGYSTEKPRRGLSARFAASIRSFRSSDDTGDKDVDLGDPEKTDLNSFLPSITHGAGLGWDIKPRGGNDAAEKVMHIGASDLTAPAPLPKDRNFGNRPAPPYVADYSTPAQHQMLQPPRGPARGVSLEDTPSAEARARFTERPHRRSQQNLSAQADNVVSNLPQQQQQRDALPAVSAPAPAPAPMPMQQQQRNSKAQAWIEETAAAAAASSNDGPTARASIDQPRRQETPPHLTGPSRFHQRTVSTPSFQPGQIMPSTMAPRAQIPQRQASNSPSVASRRLSMTQHQQQQHQQQQRARPASMSFPRQQSMEAQQSPVGRDRLRALRASQDMGPPAPLPQQQQQQQQQRQPELRHQGSQASLGRSLTSRPGL
ncbi:unnamed protein product [Jaminaea pallidilutea]